MSTLVTMVGNISRKLGDQTVGNFYSAAKIKQSVGEALRYYVQQMVLRGVGYFEDTADLNLVANTEAIDLTALSPTYWFTSQIERYVTGGTIPLTMSERRYTSNISIGVGSGDSYLPNYKYRGTDLILEPTPSASETAGLKIDYVYVPTFPTSASADAFEFDANFPTIYEVNVENRAVITLLEGMESVGGVVDWQTWRQDLADLDRVFMDSIRRDEGQDSVQYVGVNYNNF